jgi:hypothetical protein
MHNFDRTSLESAYGEYETYGEDEGYYGEGEYYGEDEGYYGESESEYYGESESYGESPFSEAEEMELAAELLSVGSEAELDQFFGKLFRRVGRTIGKVVKSPIGRALGGIVKGVAKRALPIVGGALGNLVLPGVGGVIGSKLAGGAGSLFGLELEGLSQEDQEYEIARQVVRFAGAAAGNAAQAAPTASPQQAAQTAAAAAARQYAPGLLRANAAAQPASAMPRAPQTQTGGCRHRHPQAGRWMRRGRSIILLGV